MTADYQWIGAYKRRRPARRISSPIDPHAELFTAFQRDQRLEDLPDEIAAELDRAFHVDLV